jgi:hypothetical protein
MPGHHCREVRADRSGIVISAAAAKRHGGSFVLGER